MDAAARCRLPKLRVVAGLLRGRRWQEGELFYAPGEPLPQVGAAWERRFMWGEGGGQA